MPPDPVGLREALFGIDSIERSRATQFPENERGPATVPAPRSFARVSAPVESTDRSER
jgi:hypothetical protein